MIWLILKPFLFTTISSSSEKKVNVSSPEFSIPLEKLNKPIENKIRPVLKQSATTFKSTPPKDSFQYLRSSNLL